MSFIGAGKGMIKRRVLLSGMQTLITALDALLELAPSFTTMADCRKNAHIVPRS